MLSREFLIEAAAPRTGRKYQHLEDLVYTNGSQGALHAIERLSRLAQDYGTVEVKWDGSPVYYWGRDDSGKFYFFPKNAWGYLARGKSETRNGVSTVMDSSAAVKEFIANTGSVSTPKEQQQRQRFAEISALMYDLFERATPENFRGFVEGGILFGGDQKKQLVTKSGRRYWQFQPNVTRFTVAAASGLGEKIQQARVAVAVTGYYRDLGSTDETRPTVEQLKSLDSNADLLVQGPVYVENAPQVNTRDINMLSQLEQQVLNNRQIIDDYLSPKPSVSNPGGKIYEFVNDNRGAKNLVSAWPAWVRSTQSAKAQASLLGDRQGYTMTLKLVQDLAAMKDRIIQDWMAGMARHSVISQENPEGFAQAPQGGYKYDLPDQFVKFIQRGKWQPR